MARLSRREQKAQLFATLDVAIRQAGTTAWDADGLYSGVVGAMRQGRRWPWYKINEDKIMAAEGGRDMAILAIAGMALGNLSQGMEPALAAQKAADMWREDIRKQWQIRPDDAITAPIGVTVTGETHDVAMFEPEPHAELEFTDPRLIELWPTLTDRQREVLSTFAETGNRVMTAELLGVANETVRDSIKRVALKTARLEGRT